MNEIQQIKKKTRTHTQMTKNVRALSLLFFGICAIGSSVHVIHFFSSSLSSRSLSLSEYFLAVVFFHNHSANGEFSDTSMGFPLGLALANPPVATVDCSLSSFSFYVRFVFLDIIHCSNIRRHHICILHILPNRYVCVCSYGFNSVVEKLRTCQQGGKRAKECWEKGGIEKYKRTVVAARYPICQCLCMCMHFFVCASPLTRLRVSLSFAPSIPLASSPSCLCSLHAPYVSLNRLASLSKSTTHQMGFIHQT